MSTGGCVLVVRGYECVHRWMCPMYCSGGVYSGVAVK